MSKDESEFSTDMLVGSFAGASPTNFIMPWSQDRFRDIEEAPPDLEQFPSDLAITFERAVAGSFWSHGVEFTPDITGQQPNVRSVMKRLLGHVLLDFLPDKTLDEINQQLLDAIEFYSTEPLPPLLIQPEHVHAEILGRFDREPMVLDDEG